MPKKKKKTAKKSKWLSGLQQSARTFFKVGMRIVPIALLSVLIYFGFVRVREALYADSALEIKQIQITPEGFVPAALKAEIDKKWIGKNIFTADVQDVSRLLTRDPAVLKAETVKQFPATLAVEITPRKPFARVTYVRGGTPAVLSEDGVVLEILDAKSGDEMLVLDAFETDWKKPEKGKWQAPKGLQASVEFYHLFQQHPLAAQEKITRMSLDYLGNLTITLNQGPEVKLGRHPVSLLRSLHKLDPFLDPVERPKIQYIDLQFEDVVVKKRTR